MLELPKQTKEELQRQLDELRQKKAASKAAKKAKKAGATVKPTTSTSSNSTSATNTDETQPKPVDGVVTIRRPQKTATSVQLRKQEEIRKRAMQKVQEQQYREIVARTSKNDVLEIQKMLADSANIFSFYQEFMAKYKNADILLAFNILDKGDVELFKYVVANGIENELYQGEVQLYDSNYIQLEKDKFFEYKAKHPEYNTNVTVLEDYLPHLYVLGNKAEYELINAMSLKGEITLLSEEKDVIQFEKDEGSKVIILCKHPYSDVLPSYIRVKNSQDFPIFATFNLQDMPSSQKIVPFNRENLLKKVSLR